jgi:hypothetical protein
MNPEMNPYDTSSDARDRARPVSVTHLVLGLVFLGAAGLWLLAAPTGFSAPDLEISGPVVLILAGVIGLAASFANAHRRRERGTLDSPYDNHREY